MGRKAPDPQDEAKSTSISLPLRLRDRVDEAAEAAGMDRSAWVTRVLKDRLGMK